MGKLLFHGSCFQFKEFDSLQFRTGEGGNLFGEGYYLTDSFDIADFYAQHVTKKLFITGDTESGIFKTPVPSYCHTADLQATLEKQVSAFTLDGNILDVGTYIISDELKAIILKAAYDENRFESASVERSFQMIREFKDRIRNYRGELDYIIQQVGAGNHSFVTSIVSYLMEQGYDGVKYLSNKDFESKDLQDGYNYSIWNKSSLTGIKVDMYAYLSLKAMAVSKPDLFQAMAKPEVEFYPVGIPSTWNFLKERRYSEATNREHSQEFTAKNGERFYIQKSINQDIFKVFSASVLDQAVEQGGSIDKESVGVAVFDTSNLLREPRSFSGYTQDESIQVADSHRRLGIATAITQFAENFYQAQYKPTQLLSPSMQGFVSSYMPTAGRVFQQYLQSELDGNTTKRLYALIQLAKGSAADNLQMFRVRFNSLSEKKQISFFENIVGKVVSKKEATYQIRRAPHPVNDFPDTELGRELYTKLIRETEQQPPYIKKYPIGTFRINEDGLIDQLRCYPIASLIRKEVPGEETVKKYSDWIKNGSMPPPIEGVMNYAANGGKIVTTDGHHRISSLTSTGHSYLSVWAALTSPLRPFIGVHMDDVLSDLYFATMQSTQFIDTRMKMEKELGISEGKQFVNDLPHKQERKGKQMGI